MTNRSSFRQFLVPMTAYMALVFLVPLILVAFTSVHDAGAFTLRGYVSIFRSKLYGQALLNTATISIIVGLCSAFFGYIVAYHLSQLGSRQRTLYLILVMLPFWTSVLVKTFAFTLILGSSGIINSALSFLYGSKVVVPLIFNRVGVVIGLVHWLLPFAVFPILNNLLAQDKSVKEAAAMMGASRMRVFFKITLPQSVPGIVAGVGMCTVIATGSIVTPAVLGGRGEQMLANLVDLYVREILDWTTASSISVTMLLLVGVALALFVLIGRLGAHRRQMKWGTP